jgi:hypothetical protein
MAGRAHERSREMGDAALSRSAAYRLAIARDALTAVDVALELVCELPPGTTGPVLDALRKRVASAIAALNDVRPPTETAV